jgi:hypothetical protein
MNIKVWLTRKGATKSYESRKRKVAMPPYLEGLVVDMQPHRKGERYYVKVEWSNKEFGTYYSDSGFITFNRPKNDVISSVKIEDWEPVTEMKINTIGARTITTGSIAGSYGSTDRYEINVDNW